MSTMRAVIIEATGGPEQLKLATVEQPAAVSAEFLVKVIAAGVNPVDAKTRAGRGAASAIAKFPAILGNDFSGIVMQSPFEAHPIKVGDAVYGMTMVPRFAGTYAEYIAVPAMFIARKPPSLLHTEAAGVPLAALTAWGAVVDVAKAHEGQRMLIHAGAGGVGHFAIQFAHFFGAHVTTTASARNASWLRGLGADVVIDYSTSRFEDHVRDVDVVIDLIGSVQDDTGTRSLSVLKPGGLIVSVPTGTWPALSSDAAAVGMRGTGYRVSPDGSTLAVISRLLESLDVRVFVDHVFDLEQVRAAHEALETGHTRGKIVLAVSHD